MGKKIQRFKRRFHRFSKIADSVALKSILVVFVVVIGVGYIGKINNTSTKGYVIQDLEERVKELQKENQRLSVEAAEHSSMQNVKKRVDQIGMEQAEDVQYLTPVGSVVARR
jgi:cell division protein FtsL